MSSPAHGSASTEKANGSPPTATPRVSESEAGELAARLMSGRDQYLSFLRGRIRSGADADDLFQRGILRATQNAGALRDPSRTEAWFFQILRRLLADHYATWALRERKLALLAADLEEATEEEVAVCGCSLGQLERIRPEYADILRRVDIDEVPIAEAAAALGVTVNNATVRLHRARRALREQLLAFCGADSMQACQACSCDE